MHRVALILLLIAAATCGFPDGNVNPIGEPRRLRTENPSNDTSEISASVIETSEVTPTGKKPHRILGVGMKDVIKLIVATGELARHAGAVGPCVGLVNFCSQNTDNNNYTVLLEQLDEMQDRQRDRIQEVFRSFKPPV